MPISVTCPKCGSRIQAPDRAAGRSAPCPRCGITITVPGNTPEILRPILIAQAVETEPPDESNNHTNQSILPWYKRPFGVLAICACAVLASFGIGWIVKSVFDERSNPSTREPLGTGPKTTDEARQELQRRIDRYLGGQRDGKLFNMQFRLVEIEGKIGNIEIVRVLPRVGNEGGHHPNKFVAVIRCTLETDRATTGPVTKEVTINVFEFESGKWVID